MVEIENDFALICRLCEKNISTAFDLKKLVMNSEKHFKKQTNQECYWNKHLLELKTKLDFSTIDVDEFLHEANDILVQTMIKIEEDPIIIEDESEDSSTNDSILHCSTSSPTADKKIGENTRNTRECTPRNDAHESNTDSNKNSSQQEIDFLDLITDQEITEMTEQISKILPAKEGIGDNKLNSSEKKSSSNYNFPETRRKSFLQANTKEYSTKRRHSIGFSLSSDSDRQSNINKKRFKSNKWFHGD